MQGGWSRVERKPKLRRKSTYKGRECPDVPRARRLSAESNGITGGVYLECGGRENKDDDATKLDSSNRVRRTGFPRIRICDEQWLTRCKSVLDWPPLRFHVLKRLHP